MPVKTLMTLMLAFALTSQSVLADRSERDLQQLIEELTALTDKSRKERAADRWLQRALEDLVTKYYMPWQNEILFDDFRDGNFTSNPRWNVISGQFRVEYGKGLNTYVEDYRTSPQQDSQGQDAKRPEDVLSEMLVGAIFDKALGPSENTEQNATEPVQKYGPAEIQIPANITNAFSLETRFTMRASNDKGQVELAVLQGSSARYGYRLVLTSGERKVLELERIRDGRVSIVEGVRLDKELADGRQHDLTWQHAPNGQIRVAVDGQTLFEISDRSFKNPYKYLQLGVISGDFTLHQVRITGT